MRIENINRINRTKRRRAIKNPTKIKRGLKKATEIKPENIGLTSSLNVNSYGLNSFSSEFIGGKKEYSPQLRPEKLEKVDFAGEFYQPDPDLEESVFRYDSILNKKEMDDGGILTSLIDMDQEQAIEDIGEHYF
jgi:hypothetical protein